jgi:hypothetical protein
MVSLSAGTVNLSKGGPSQNVQVSITDQNGFSGSVTVTVNGLPAGVMVSPSSLSLTSGAPGTFAFTASSSAGLVQQSVTLEAVSGSLMVNTPVQFNVNGAPVPDPFHVIGGTLVHGFYDQGRQLLFATNLGLNEVDVISGANLAVVARVAVPQPVGIDQMADNKTLVIGTAAQQIVTLDEDSLTVTPHPVTGIAKQTFGLFYPTVVAMANGKVLIIGQEEGIDSSDILDGGQFLLEWDSVADTFKIIQPASGQVNFEVDSLARSADHNWAVFSADQFYLYSSATDSTTTVPLNTVNPPQNTFGVRGYAMNVDGSKIAVASAQQVTFLDRSFNLLATVPIPAAFQLARTTVTFNPNGNLLLLQYDLPAAIEVVDANQFGALGWFSADVEPEDNFDRLLGTDSAGRAFVGNSPGMVVVDMTQPRLANPPANTGRTLSGPLCQSPNSTNAPLNTSQQVQILASLQEAGTSYYIGGQPAPLLSNLTEIQIPASSVSGPVEIECIDSTGNSLVRAFDFSYGVDAIGASANLLPPIGNPTVLLFGFGFSSTATGAPTVAIGGQPALNVASLGDLNFATLQGAAVQVPGKGSAQTVDITVTGPNGTGTIANALTYIPSATIIPATGLLQVLFDTHRNVLYALKAAQVEVLNPSTLQFQSTITLPGPAGSIGNYSSMALSPDGSKLVAASPNGYVAVLDPDTPATVSVVSVSTSAGFPGSLVITKLNQALISGSPNTVVDLATLNVSSVTGSLGNVLRSSADGSVVYGVAVDISNGEVFSIDPATFATQSATFGLLFWTDLAVSPDGSRFAAVDGDLTADGDIVGFFDSGLHFLNTNQYPLVSPPGDIEVLGSVFSPQGKVLVVPLGNSIEFWDAAQGTLRARLMTPEELTVITSVVSPAVPQIALDSAGQTIFATSKSGLTVMQLSQPVDSLPSQPWASVVRTSGKPAGLSGGISARAAAMRVTKQK